MGDAPVIPKRKKHRLPMGRPVTVGRGAAHAARAVTLRLSAAEAAALESVAGSPAAVGRYLRGAGLALPQMIDALDSAGDTLTDTEAIRLALGYARQVTPATSGEE